MGVSMTTNSHGTDRPLLPDELAKQPDVAANAAPPPEVATRLAERRLHVTGLPSDHDAATLLHGLADDRSSLELVFPGGVFLGQPGRTGERLERAEHDLPSQSHTASHRPDWVTQALTSPGTNPLLEQYRRGAF